MSSFQCKQSIANDNQPYDGDVLFNELHTIQV